MIFAKERDPRLITVRRGGTLSEADHRLLALWAADCATHVLHFFADVMPADQRVSQAITAAQAWARGELSMMKSRAFGGHANGAARDLKGAAREAAYAAGQAACTPHVADHGLGAAAYGIRAARAAVLPAERDAAGHAECTWQREQLPVAIRELVLDDQRRRNENCWDLFDF